MMMDAITEKYPFRIDQKLLVILALLVALVASQNPFDCFPDEQIVPVLLIVENVPSSQSGFGEEIGQFFLLQSQLVETWRLIAQHLYIRKLIGDHFETLVLGVGFRFGSLTFPGSTAHPGDHTQNNHLEFHQLFQSIPPATVFVKTRNYSGIVAARVTARAWPGRSVLGFPRRWYPEM